MMRHGQTFGAVALMVHFLVGCSSGLDDSVSEAEGAAKGKSRVGSSGSSSQASQRPPIDFLAIPVGNIDGGDGHVGVDIGLRFPNGDFYNPCHHSSDPNYGACMGSVQGPISYYSVEYFWANGTKNFPNGIFIRNSDPNYCREAGVSWCKPEIASYQHQWAQYSNYVGLEFYSHQANIGWLRTDFDTFPNLANGGAYSADLGDVRLPHRGDPFIGEAAGIVTRAGAPVSKGEVGLDWFGQNVGARSSTGHSLYSFGSTGTDSAGRYATSPLTVGSYRVYVRDAAKGTTKVIHAQINSTHESVHFDLDAPCYGQLFCE